MDRRAFVKFALGGGLAASGGYLGLRTLRDEDAGDPAAPIETPERPREDPVESDLAPPDEPTAESRSGQTIQGITPRNQSGEALRTMETWLGVEHAVVGTFVGMDASPERIRSYVLGHLESIWAAGKIPHVFLQPEFAEATEGALNRDIAAGRFDPQLEVWADALAEWIRDTPGPDRRCYLNLAPEFNGNWSPWSPAVGEHDEADFVAMWRHVHDMVMAKALGSADVQWIWALDNTTRNVDRAACYPGAEYVDWGGIHGYNWTNWHEWRSPDELYSATIAFHRELADHPIALTEFGCSPETTDGGVDVVRKNDWIASAYRYMWDRDVRLALYFNIHGNAAWGVFDVAEGAEIVTIGGETFAVYPAYREAIRAPGMLGPHPAHPRVLITEEFQGAFRG